MKINIGCGLDIKPGWVNIDQQTAPGVDCVVNLEDGKLPFPDDSVDEAYCSHVLEHLWEWEPIILEVFRVLKPGGRFEVKVPYGWKPCAYHVRTFDVWTLDWFIQGMAMEETNSLEPMGRFLLEHRRVNRKFPMLYHVRKYLWRNAPLRFPIEWIGQKHEIHWILRKPDRGIYDGGACGNLVEYPKSHQVW